MSEKISRGKRKGGKGALMICIIVIAGLLGVIGFLLHQKTSGGETKKRNVVVNEKNAEEVASELLAQEKTPVGSYLVTMNSTWNFTSGDVASENAYVKNADANSNSVYFDIVRTDTGDTIYESPILPVGTYLEDITLDTVLQAGTYDCVLTYYLLDEEDNAVSKTNLALTIVIEN